MKPAKPHLRARQEYLAAFSEIVRRVGSKLEHINPKLLPVRMYVAGGAARYLLAGGKVSSDVDAAFSRRLVLGEEVEVSYRDADHLARLLYLDRNYNDTLGLLHEDAYEDSIPMAIPGVDASKIEVRALSPVDLAVAKLARFSESDRDDIELLAQEGLVDSKRLRARAEEALGGYVGDLAAVRNSIELACRVVDAARAGNHGKGK